MKRRGSKLLANTTTTRNNTSSSSAQSSYSSGAKRIKVENVRILLDRSVSSELLIDKIRDVRDKAERILYPILMFLKEKFKTEEWDTKIMYDKIDVIILKSQLDLVRDGNYIFTFFLKYYNIFEGLAFSEFANAGNPFDVLSTMQPRFKRLSSILHLRNCKKFIQLSFRYGVSVELSTENKNDRDVVMKAVVADGHLLQNFAEKFRNDRKVVLNAIYNDNGPGCQVFKLVSDNLKNDREFVLKAVQLNHCVFGEAPKCFRDDKEIAIDAVNQNGRNLEYVSINLENDREVLLSARNLDRGEYKITLTEEIMKDREFMLEFISRNPKCLAYSKHFWKDRDFLFEIMELDGMALSISNEFRNDKEIVLQAVRQNGEALKFASKELREDRDVIMAAVERSGLFILSEYKEGSIESGTELYLTNLKNNREIALRSIQMSCFQIRYISDELRNDRSFIFDAVQVNGKVLEYLSEKFKNDKEIVLQAVRQNGEALKFASKELRADREVAMEAVKENGKAIYFSRCKAKELYLEAVKTHPVDVLEEISDDLYFDFEIAKTIVEYWDVTEYHFEMQHWTTIY